MVLLLSYQSLHAVLCHIVQQILGSSSSWTLFVPSLDVLICHQGAVWCIKQSLLLPDIDLSLRPLAAYLVRVLGFRKSL